MTSAALFLIVVTLAGLSAVRWATRLAPLTSELPAKTFIATLLAALGAASELGWLQAAPWLTTVILVLAPIYVFGPLALIALVRAGVWRAARAVMQVLYWSPEGRAALGRLLAQAALQEGNATAALGLAPRHDALLLSLAHLLEGDWEAVLAVDAPHPAGDDADNAHLIAAARIEALLELGQVEQARHETQALKTRFEAGKQGPLGYRAVVLSEARLAAYHGDFETARQLLEQPLVGARPGDLYRILGRAGERAGRSELAAKAYSAAYSASRGEQRQRFAADLARLGVPVPKGAQAVTAKPWATYGLAAALALAYGAQLLFDRSYGLVRAAGQVYEASSVLAAFLQELPGLPAIGAWWRYLSYAFLHGNLPHIGFNLWVLLDIGRLYERRRGWGDLLIAFVAGTVVGAYLTTIFQAGQPLILVGASGGILGVAGALLAEALLSRNAADRLLLRSLVQWMLLLLVFSVAVPGVSLWGHVGGVVGGFAYGVLRLRLPLGRGYSQAVGLLAIGLMALALISAVSTIVPLLP